MTTRQARALTTEIALTTLEFTLLLADLALCHIIGHTKTLVWQDFTDGAHGHCKRCHATLVLPIAKA